MRKQSTRRMSVARKRQDALMPTRLPERDIHRIKKQLPYCRDVSGIEWDRTTSTYTLTLIGTLTRNYRLAKPLRVSIAWDGDYWLVTDPLYFNHAIGQSIPKAIAHFRRCIVDAFEFLAEHKGAMSLSLQNELAYLQEMIEEQEA